MADQRNSSSVDDILEALKQGQNTPAAPGSVDDILADLGLEQEKAQPAQQRPCILQNHPELLAGAGAGAGTGVPEKARDKAARADRKPAGQTGGRQSGAPAPAGGAGGSAPVRYDSDGQ